MGKKTTTTGPKGKKTQAVEKPAPKNTLEANWMRSQMTELRLQEMEKTGMLPSREEIQWRAPGEETRPQPREGEVVVFADHITRGFRPPGSRFFRNLLGAYGLHPQDLSPNSVLNICHFQVFCEVYLQRKPTLTLFAELFYGNKQTEYSGGPLLECGGISIQRQMRSTYPSMRLSTHVKT